MQFGGQPERSRYGHPSGSAAGRFVDDRTSSGLVRRRDRRWPRSGRIPGGVHNQQRAFARGQRTGHFVGEVHVTWGVDEVQRVWHVVLHVLDADGRGFDRDAAFTFQIHRVEHLGFGLTIRDRAGGLQQSIGQGALAVINVGDDGKVANRHSPPILGSPTGSPQLRRQNRE